MIQDAVASTAISFVGVSPIQSQPYNKTVVS